jgi:transposase-like protein
MEERGADADHSIVQKWVVHYVTQLAQSSFRKEEIGRQQLEYG